MTTALPFFRINVVTTSITPVYLMASQSKSKWADDPPETAEAIAQRKREKEEKKRLKEEKLRKAAAIQQGDVQNASTTLVEPEGGGYDSERPAKRRRTSNPPAAAINTSGATSFKLLEFPTSRFGPCRDVELYELLNNIEEGSYGMVSRARAKATGEVVALKRLKMEYTNDGFPVTGLREIQTLMASKHPNIVNLREVVTGGGLNE